MNDAEKYAPEEARRLLRGSGKGERLTEKLLKSRIEESDENLNLMAGKLKATNTISLADAYISAVCQEYAGILVHKDPHFEKMSPLIKEYKLPYKTV